MFQNTGLSGDSDGGGEYNNSDNSDTHVRKWVRNAQK